MSIFGADAIRSLDLHINVQHLSRQCVTLRLPSCPFLLRPALAGRRTK